MTKRLVFSLNLAVADEGLIFAGTYHATSLCCLVPIVILGRRMCIVKEHLDCLCLGALQSHQRVLHVVT